MNAAVRRFGAALAAATMLAGCAMSADHAAVGKLNGAHSVGGAPRKGGDLTVALAQDPDNLDPALAQSETSGDVLAPMCEGLYRRDANALPVPRLAAAAPVLTDGGKTVTIKLRSGVVFNDGTPFNATAVKQSMQLGAALTGSSFTPVLQRFTAIETPNPTTIVFRLKAPYSPLENQLTYLLIGSPTQRRKLGDKFGTHPVCVGAFTYVKRVNGVSITMRKSDRYYNRDRVNLDRVTFKVIDDVNAREAAIRTGAADIANSIPLTDVSTFDGAVGVRVISEIGAGWVGVGINVGNANGVGKKPVPRTSPLAKSALLRRALSLTIDRKALSILTSDGLSYPGCSPIPPSSPYFDHPTCPGADVAEAKRLVKQSGYHTPIKLNMITYTSPTNSRMAEAVQSMVAKAGFQLTITTFDLSTWISREYGGKFDATLAVWLGEGEPSQDVTGFFQTGGPNNITGFSNPKVDALLDRAGLTSDRTQRTALYGQAIRRVSADGSTVFLQNPAVAVAARDDIAQFSVNPLGNIDLAYAGFAR